MALKEMGKKVPAFKALSTSGETITDKDLLGTTYVVYFYPKDHTPGCTKEACSIRDNDQALKKKGVRIFGVSPDSIASHEKFIAKQALPFELLTDPDHKMAEKFGAWGEKSMFGRKYMGIIRSTFVIDTEGKIAHVFKKVKTATHGEEILSVL